MFSFFVQHKIIITSIIMWKLASWWHLSFKFPQRVLLQLIFLLYYIAPVLYWVSENKWVSHKSLLTQSLRNNFDLNQNRKKMNIPLYKAKIGLSLKLEWKFYNFAVKNIFDWQLICETKRRLFFSTYLKYLTITLISYLIC